MKVAIVHDWLYGGGAERVVLELHRMFPDAPIYTSYCSDEWRQKLDDKVITGYLQYWPFKQLRKFLPPLRQRWFRKLDLSDFDLVISSSGNGEAKFVSVKKPAIHVCYCHTPTHFYWRHYDGYIQNPSFRPKWLARLGLKFLVKPLRKRDYEAAQRVDFFIANSTHIQTDIKKYYNRDSEVIFPPVDLDRFKSVSNPARHGFIVVGRQVPFKRIDLAVKACSRLGLPLTVLGTGPDHSRLTKLAGNSVKFVIGASDDEVVLALQTARCFIFTAYEDFGVAPVEALAAGTPVIAYKAGGALDYVVPGKTGEFFTEQTVESLTTAIQNFDPTKYSEKELKQVADRFSAANFRKNLEEFLKKL